MHAGKIQNGCTPAVLQQKGIYMLYVYKIFFFIFRLIRYTDVCFFSLSGVLFPREYTTQLNETVKHDNIREIDRRDGRYMYIPSFALPTCTKQHVMLNLTSTGVCITGTQHCMCVTCFFDQHGGGCCCTEPSEKQRVRI